MGSNAKSGSAAKITLEKFDDLFGGNTAQESGVEQIINAPLAELYTFKDHPFRVEDDEKMEETTESIRQYGVLVPGIARPRAGGGYEIIAGHRRKRGSELAGKTEMPVIVRNYTDDEATIIMVDSNIQREDILPSEKARAYKMKYEAMKHQGKKSGRTPLMKSGKLPGRTLKRFSGISGSPACLMNFLLWWTVKTRFLTGRGHFLSGGGSAAVGTGSHMRKKAVTSAWCSRQKSRNMARPGSLPLQWCA